jgi:hypothetical protein
LLPASTAAWCWNAPDGADPEVLEVTGRLAQPPAGRKSSGGKVAPERVESVLTAWLERARSAPPSDALAIEAVAWAHVLPQLAGLVSGDIWQALFDRLLAATAAGRQAANDRPLVGQLLSGELPLALAYLLPELRPCRERLDIAREALSAGMAELLDGEGLIHASHWRLMRPLLACWTRCRAMGNRLDGGCWNEDAQAQYEWLIRQALRFTRPGGGQALAAGPEGAWCAPLFEAALRLDGDPGDHRIAALVLPKAKGGKEKPAGRKGPPPAPVHSEWAMAAMLRTGWTPSDPWLAAVYPGTEVQIEVCTGRRVLWSGPWALDLQFDGRRLEPRGEWEEVCWVSDKDVDYVELEGEWSGGVRVQRHLMLSHEGGFLFLADAILGPSRGRWEYASRLPLAEKIVFEGAKEHWDGRLVDGKPLASVLPLALPEWRTDPRPGSLRADGSTLELRQSGEGQCLFAPLVFDLKAARIGKPLTWRQLTVAENLTIQPADVAVGYRVMLDKQQWLIYRSLGPRGNRTLLGHNLATEMLVARFLRNGEVEAVLEIE